MISRAWRKLFCLWTVRRKAGMSSCSVDQRATKRQSRSSKHWQLTVVRAGSRFRLSTSGLTIGVIRVIRGCSAFRPLVTRHFCLAGTQIRNTAFAGANFTAGVRERGDANRTRKPGTAIGNRRSALVKGVYVLLCCW